MAKSTITKSAMLILMGIMVFGISTVSSAQQAAEELPKALGTYLSAMEGMIKIQDMPLKHAWAANQYTFFTGYKEDRVYPFLEKWAAPEIKNVSGQDLSMVVYFSLGARDPEKIKLYRLRTKKDVKPFITMLEEVRLSAVPITDLPGLAGNMVRLVPDHTLQQGNYIFMEGDIDSKLLFSIELKTSLVKSTLITYCMPNFLKRIFVSTKPTIAGYIETLNQNKFPSLRGGLREEFENNGFTLSGPVDVKVIEENSRWRVIDGEANTSYLVRKEKNRLDVYDGNEKRSWGFTVDGGGELWRTPAFWAKCIACLCAPIIGRGPIQ